MADKRCRRHGTPGRTLHLIDVENLVGGSTARPTQVADALGAYRATVAIGPGDHVVIASGRRLLVAAGLAWPGARLLLGTGVDGADRALLDAAQPERLDDIRARFGERVAGLVEACTETLRQPKPPWSARGLPEPPCSFEPLRLEPLDLLLPAATLGRPEQVGAPHRAGQAPSSPD